MINISVKTKQEARQLFWRTSKVSKLTNSLALIKQENEMKRQDEQTECEIQLREMVDAYAEDVNNGLVRFYELEEGEEGEHYEAYSVKYIINQDGELDDVMILLAGGGPNIWLDTWAREVQGFWGGDKYSRHIYDYDYILDFWLEMYEATR